MYRDHLWDILFCRSIIFKLASFNLSMYSASKILFNYATTNGTSYWRLLLTTIFVMKISLSFASFALILNLCSVTSSFLFNESMSFRRFWLSISEFILEFFYSAFCFFFKISISFSKRLSFMLCSSIVFLRANI